MTVVPALYLRLILVALIWGASFTAGRVLAVALPHLLAASARFVVGVACLLVMVRVLEGRLPRLTARQAWQTAWMGLTGVFLYNLFFLGSLGKLPASRTALIVALNPALTALLQALWLRDPLSARRLAGIALAFAGVAFALSHGRPANLLEGGIGIGELLMMGGAASWAVYTVVGREAMRALTPLVATTWASIWGLGWLLIGAAVEARGAVPWSWAQLGWSHLVALLFIGVAVTALSFVWYLQGVRVIGPTRAAVFNNLVPIFGMVIGVLMLGEPLHWSMVAGGLLALAGVTLVNLPGRTDERGKVR